MVRRRTFRLLCRSTAVLLYSVFLHTRAITVEVPPRQKLCVYQYYESDDSGQAEVFVVNGGNLDIRLTVEGPFKDDAHGVPSNPTQETTTVYDEIVASSSGFINREHGRGVVATADGIDLTWPTKPGAYQVCLDNAMSQIQTKLVEFALPAPKSKQEALEAERDTVKDGVSTTNATIPDDIKQSYKEDFALLQKSSDHITKAFRKIQEKQIKERHRLALQTAANKNNHTKMVISSLLETIVFIGVSFFQLFYVRRWFEGRGIGPICTRIGERV